jgi:hypothetical protein
MYLREIMGEIKKHMVANNILKENAALNMPSNKEGGELIDLTDESRIKYLLSGRESRQDYRYWEPFIEEVNNKIVCTYIIYSPLYQSR